MLAGSGANLERRCVLPAAETRGLKFLRVGEFAVSPQDDAGKRERRPGDRVGEHRRLEHLVRGFGQDRSTDARGVVRAKFSAGPGPPGKDRPGISLPGRRSAPAGGVADCGGYTALARLPRRPLLKTGAQCFTRMLGHCNRAATHNGLRSETSGQAVRNLRGAELSRRSGPLNAAARRRRSGPT